jgi:hypothetical protein
VVEINLQAMLLNPHYPERFKLQYLEYLAELKSQKVKLCIGSDCHSAHYEVDFEAACLMLDRKAKPSVSVANSIGIKDEDLWRLPPRST